MHDQIIKPKTRQDFMNQNWEHINSLLNSGTKIAVHISGSDECYDLMIVDDDLNAECRLCGMELTFDPLNNAPEGEE